MSILITAANGEMAALHDRMPVILERDAWPVWLGEAEGDPVALLRPAASGIPPPLAGGQGGRQRNDGPELLLPHVPPDHADAGALRLWVGKVRRFPGVEQRRLLPSPASTLPR